METVWKLQGSRWIRALSGRMDCRVASGESGCSPAVLCPEAPSFSSVVGGLLWSWSNDAAPIWCLLAQSHRLSTPPQIHTHTHTRNNPCYSPDKHTCDRYFRHLCSYWSQKCVSVFAAGHDRLSCPPPPTVRLRPTCVRAGGSLSVFFFLFFFWGDLIMSRERSRVSAVKWPASTVH